MAFLLPGHSLYAQTTVQIGVGTDTSASTLYSPIYRFSATSSTTAARSNILFTAAEMSGAGIANGDTIKAIAFNKLNTAQFTNSASYTVYMANTMNTALATTLTWASIQTTHKQVFNRSTTFNISNTPGWVTLVLDSPTIYTGGSFEIATNLTMVGSGGASDKFQWEYTSTTSPTMIVGVGSAGATLNGTAATYKWRPNIKFTFTSGGASMVYDSTTVSQPSTINMQTNSTNQLLLGVKVYTRGANDRLTIDQLNFAYAGTSVADLSNLRLWTTGVSPVFDTTKQIGSTVSNISGVIGFTGTNDTLLGGTNYFWLTADIPSSATICDSVDLSLVNVVLGGVTHTATTPNPAGSNLLKAPMNGTYTIDKMGSGVCGSNNYQSFAAAFKDLNDLGVTGPVVFNIAADTFDGSLVLNEIAGISSTNTITFAGAGKLATILRYDGSAAGDMATVLLNGTDYVTFRDMTVAGLDNSFGVGFLLTNNADHNRFINMKIEMMNTSTATTTAGIAVSGSATALATNGNTGSYNLFDSLEITGAYYGITLSGVSTTSFAHGNIITNCNISEQNTYGIRSYGQEGNTISNNVVSNLRATTHYALYNYYSANYTISKNKITVNDLGLYTGYTNRSEYNNALATTIENNMIYTVADNGMYFTNSDSLRIYHNSVSAGASGSDGAIYFTSSNGIDCRNNIFMNNTTGVAHVMYLPATVTFTHLDYNNYYTLGTGFVYVSASVSHASLTAWQSAAPSFNVHSYNLDPNFVSAVDLHLQAASPSLYGDSLGVLTDIDGNVRSATTPNAGAHEKPVPPVNMAIAELVSPTGLFCAGNYDVKVKVRNKGQTIITSVDVEWALDSVMQLPITISAPIDTAGSVAGNDTIITLSNIFFSPTTARHIKVWTSLPNGMPDPVTADDTLWASPASALGGSYTIGDSTRDFSSFSSAVAALQSRGVCAPVVFHIDSGTFAERITLMSTVIGISAVNNVQFIGAGKTKTTLTYTGSGTSDMATVLLNGADHYTFRDMTVEGQGATHGVGFQLTGDADSNRFINMNIKMNTASTTTTTAGIAVTGSATSLTSGAASGSYNIFDSLYVTGAYYGITITGPSTSNFTKSNMVSNSSFVSQYYYGMRSYCHDGFSLYRNKVSGLRNTTNYGIYNYYAANFRIEANNIVVPNDNAGIYNSNLNKTGYNRNIVSLIANNMVSVGADYGLYMSSCDSVRVVHNTIASSGSSTTATAYFSSTNGIYCRNNIFVNRNPGTSYVMNVPTTANFISLDYNNYYGYGSGMAYVSTSGTYSDLATWRTAQPGYNSNSVSSAPPFTSATDLHLQPIGSAVNGIDVGITDDIDGNLRGNPPTIGAHERISPANSASIIEILPKGVCNGTYPIEARVVNIGKNKITQLTIEWELNGAPQTPISYTTPIDTLGSVAGAEARVLLTTQSLTSGVTLHVKAWSSMPNNQPDPVTIDDTASATVQAALSGSYTIPGNYPTISAAVADVNNFGICGPVTFSIADGTYNEKFVIQSFFSSDPSNSITFRGNDSSLVKIKYPTSASNLNNYLAKLNDVRNITFENITFERDGSDAYSTIFELNHTSNIRFIADHFVAPVITAANTTGTQSAIFSDDTQTEDSTVVFNCRFTGNANGLWFYSNTTQPAKGTSIENNIFHTAYANVFLKHHQGIIIKHNQITGSGMKTFDTYGISLENCDSATNISYNNIHLSRGYGIRLNGNQTDAARRAMINNNMIKTDTSGGSLACYGISLEGSCTYQDLFHNTIVTDSGSTTTTARLINSAGTSTAGIRVLNNILINKGLGYVYYIPTSVGAGFDVINHNNIYTNGPMIGTWNSTTGIANDYKLWVSTTNMDSLSSTVPVEFVSSTDLHLAATGNFNLATNVTGFVADDIDGNPRINAYQYKGAHESPVTLSPFISDGSIWAVMNPVTPVSSAGSQDLEIKVRNNGIINILSFTLDYSINGSGSSQTWNGTLAAGKDTNIVFQGVVIPTGSNNFKAWISNIDNLHVADLNTLNDTAAFTFTGTPPLIGNFLVGPGETFPTLTKVADSLTKTGIGSDLIFELTSNYTGAGEVYPITFTAPANSPYTVTIRPAAGVTGRMLAADPGTGNAMIQLSGVKRFIFDGRPGGLGSQSEWTIRYKRTASTYNSVIKLLNGACNNVFRYMTVESQSTLSTTGTINFSTSTTNTGNSNNLVEYCILRDRSDTTVAATYAGIYSSGTTGAPNSDNVIRYNQIFNFSNNGITLTATGNGNNWIIDSNHFYHNRTTAPTVTCNPINILSTDGTGYRIRGNYIGGSTVNAGGASWKHNGSNAFTAINSAVLDGIISGNIISNIEQLSTGTAVAFRGIDHSEAGSKVEISYNTISNIKSVGRNDAFTNSGLFALNGIVINAGDSILVHHNRISNIEMANDTTVISVTLSGITSTNTIYAGIYNNTISNLINRSTSGSRTTGMMIMNVTAGNVHDVYNNQVALQTNVGGSMAGIMHNSNSMQLGTINVKHNTVYIGGSPSPVLGTSWCYYRQFATTFNMENNLAYFERAGNGTAMYDNGGQTGLNANYNFYVHAGNAFSAGLFSSWKALGNDTFGYKTTPASLPSASLFTNTATGDLSINPANNTAWAVNGKGIARVDQTFDFRDSVRSVVAGTPVDIGAYEFTPNAGIDPVAVNVTPGAAPSSNIISVYGRPIATINWRSGTVPTAVNLKYFSGVPPQGATMGNNIMSYYAIDATGGSGYLYDVEFAYSPAELGVVAESNLSIAKKDGTDPWTHLSTSHVNTVTRTVKDTLLTSFSLFTLTDITNPLPAKLIRFTASKMRDDVQLAWTTASEKNLDAFGIEVSADARTFKAIGSVKAAGNSSVQQQYAFDHIKAFGSLSHNGILYYRLKMKDADGSFTYSPVASVQLNKETEHTMAVYPNPFSDELYIDITSGTQANLGISIYDMQGRMVKTYTEAVKAGSNMIMLNQLSELETGVYFIRTDVNGVYQTIKVVKQ